MSATKTVKKAAKAPADWRFTAVLYGIVSAAVVVACCLLVFAPGTAVSIMHRTAAVAGFGAGATVGSVPTFVEGIQKGIQAAR